MASAMILGSFTTPNLTGSAVNGSVIGSNKLGKDD